MWIRNAMALTFPAASHSMSVHSSIRGGVQCCPVFFFEPVHLLLSLWPLEWAPSVVTRVDHRVSMHVQSSRQLHKLTLKHCHHCNNTRRNSQRMLPTTAQQHHTSEWSTRIIPNLIRRMLVTTTTPLYIKDTKFNHLENIFTSRIIERV